MERRDFLKTSAVVGGAVMAGGAGGGCAAIGAEGAASPTPFGDMDAFLASLDKMLEEIARAGR